MRRSLSQTVKQDVLMEAGYKCANPTCRHILTLEIHHIVWVKKGGGNDASNLLALCPNCHSLHTAGHIPETAIRHWKGMLVALNHAFDRNAMDLLLFLNKQWAGVRYTSDGVLRFAGLIAANLVEFGEGIGGGLMGQTVSPSIHQLVLTDRGKLLVEAWLVGDEDKYRALLSGKLAEENEQET